MTSQQHTQHNRNLRSVVLTVSAGALLLASAFLPAQMFADTAQSTSKNIDSAVHSESLAHANSLSDAFRSASEKVLPAVVMIRTSGITRPAMQAAPGQSQEIPEELYNSPFFRRFFGDSPQGQRRMPAPNRSGMGSGVIIDPSGTILTNNHVVAGGGAVSVTLHDGRVFEATDVRTDPDTDIAVVRISVDEELPYAETGDSDGMQIGDWVIAVGSPFGLNETVTAGIISAKSRGIGITERENFLQTDAAINPGNSGGPLVNLEGKVVGINTAISSTSGGYQGIGFAIPINMASWVGEQLTAHGSVRRAFLGVAVQPVTAPLATQLGISQQRGALVNNVRPDSPADRAGLIPGDVILEFDGQPVRSPSDLQRIVERAELSATHSVVVIRDGREQILEAGVGQLDSQTTTVAPPSSSSAAPLAAAGLELSNLTDAVARQLGLSETTGVVITNVAPGSAAAEAGLDAGMVIVRIGTQPVDSLSDLEDALADHDAGDGVLLLVRSGDASRFVVLNTKN